MGSTPPGAATNVATWPAAPAHLATWALAALGVCAHPADMFVVTEAEAAAIRTAFDQRGEFATAVELRRLFPGVTDSAQVREFAHAISAWKPLPAKPRLVRAPGKGR